MGLPLSPSTTYVPNSTPPVKAADLNDVQKYLAGLYTGVYSVKSLDVDSVGGGPSLALPGTLQLYATFTGTTAPTPALRAGALTSAAIPLGWAYLNSGGTLIRGYNVFSTSRVSAGYYEVVFNASPADPSNSCAVASPRQNLAPAMSGTFAFGSSGKQGVRVAIWDKNGAPLDSNVYVIVFGE